jgi:NADH dehydrogenase
MAEVTGVDLTSRWLDTLCPVLGARKITFDYLVIATGMRPSYFGHDEFAKHAPGLKALGDAEAIRAKILSAYEAAEQTDDPDERARQMTFVQVGGGPTGVELAASIAEMASVTLRSNFRRIDPASLPSSYNWRTMS